MVLLFYVCVNLMECGILEQNGLETCIDFFNVPLSMDFHRLFDRLSDTNAQICLLVLFSQFSYFLRLYFLC